MKVQFAALALYVFGLVSLSAASAFGSETSARQDSENSSVVNADGSGDYMSLRDAFAALSVSNTSLPDHVLYIASDLQETQPLVLKRHTGLNAKLTIKPLGAPRTVSVVSSAAPSYAQELIGIDWNNSYSGSPAPICNAVIDGTLEGVEHGLTWTFSHDPQTSSLYTPHHGFAFGGSGSVEIRNCRIEHQPLTDAQSYAINIHTYTLRPVTITGNEINATQSNSSGVNFDASREWESLLPVDSMVISDNIINAARHGISVYARDAEIERNQITIEGDADELESLLGIQLSRPVTPTTSTVISSNRIVIKGGASAMVVQGIRAYSGMDVDGSLLVHNNMVSLNLDTAAESRAVRGITSVLRRPSLTEIAHNSVFLPGNQDNNEEINRNFHALGVDEASSNSLTIANNMLRVGSRWGSGMYVHSGNPFTSDGNVIAAFGDAVAATTEGTTYTLLSDWKAASGTDAMSQDIDPLPMWASPEDLHLVHSIAGLQPGVPGVLQAPVVVDIDGDQRNQDSPTPGADETEMSAQVDEWSVY